MLEAASPNRIAGIDLSKPLANLASDRRLRLLLVFAIFAALTAAWFWPIMFAPGSKVLRGPADGTLTIRGDWATSVQGKNPFTLTHDFLNGAPEGVPYLNAITWVSPIQGGATLLLHYAVGWIAAWNVFLLLGFVLTGVVTFLLLDTLGFHPLASFFGAYVLTFNPWVIDRAESGHAAFVHIWIYPALLLALLRLSRLRTARSAVLVGCLYGLTFLFAAYCGLIASVLLGTYLAVEIVRVRNLADRLWTVTLGWIAFVVCGLLLLPGLLKYAANHHTVATGISNSVTEAQTLGGSTVAYLVPSQTHPLLGGIARRDSAAHNWSEHSLFFGYTTMLLAAAAIVMLLRRRDDRRRSGIQQTAVVFAAVLLPVAWWASLKSVVHPFGIPIPTLSWFITHVTSYFRVYARIGVLVGLALAILAAYTLDRITRDVRRGRLIVVALTVLVGFELLNGQITGWNAVNPPAYDRWLATQPAGIVAHYPLPTDQTAAIRLGEREIYFQMFARQPLYNLFGPGTGDTREDAIRILSRYVTDPLTPSILAAERVRYVVLHDDVYREEGAVPPTAPSWLKLIRRFPDTRIFTLRSNIIPADLSTLLEQNAASIGLVEGLESPTTTYGSGFSQPYDLNGQEVRGLSGEGLITFHETDPNLKRAQVILRATSPTVSQTVTLTDAQNNVVGQGVIGTEPTTLILGPFPLDEGSTRFVLHSTPGATGGGPDIVMQPLQVQPLADYSVSLAAT